MAFKKNEYEQITLHDSCLFGITDREKKALPSIQRASEQPLFDKSLSRFRKRCYEYEYNHSVDLYRDCVKDLSGSIAKIMGINGRVRRMNSMMIESNIRF